LLTDKNLHFLAVQDLNSWVLPEIDSSTCFSAIKDAGLQRPRTRGPMYVLQRPHRTRFQLPNQHGVHWHERSCLAYILQRRWYFEEDETRRTLLWKRSVTAAFILVA
jgi:hypothetical protein